MIGSASKKRMWQPSGEAATSELIIAANLKHKHDCGRGLFAVTSAHLLLGNEFTAEWVMGMNGLNEWVSMT